MLVVINREVPLALPVDVRKLPFITLFPVVCIELGPDALRLSFFSEERCTHWAEPRLRGAAAAGPRAPARWGTGRRPGGPPPRKEGFGPAAAELEAK